METDKVNEMHPLPNEGDDRRSEWFVPSFGSVRFRFFIGLLFLPYTGMVLAYSIIGSMLSDTVRWGRVLSMAWIYFFGLGIAAHALDALGSKSVKPWGSVFSKTQLRLMAAVSLILAYAVAVYYMVTVVPLLWIVALLEGFFVFAYNLEWFGGRFHTDAWFAFSWGFLPVWAGYNHADQQTLSRGLGIGVLNGAFQLRRDQGFPTLQGIQKERG
jgi:hypothetical protein